MFDGLRQVALSGRRARVAYLRLDVRSSCGSALSGWGPAVSPSSGASLANARRHPSRDRLRNPAGHCAPQPRDEPLRSLAPLVSVMLDKRRADACQDEGAKGLFVRSYLVVWDLGQEEQVVKHHRRELLSCFGHRRTSSHHADLLGGHVPNAVLEPAFALEYGLSVPPERAPVAWVIGLRHQIAPLLLEDRRRSSSSAHLCADDNPEPRLVVELVVLIARRGAGSA